MKGEKGSRKRSVKTSRVEKPNDSERKNLKKKTNKQFKCSHCQKLNLFLWQ